MSETPSSAPPADAASLSGTIFLAGGGTGGHLYPGIAVAESLRQAAPNLTPIFLCTTRAIDRTILEPTGFEFIEQPIVPPVRTIGGMLRFFPKWRETKDLVSRISKERQPKAVLGLGGYAAGVAVKMAGKAGVCTALINPDVIPGKANQYLMRYVRAICCQFEQSAQYIPAPHREKVRITGCPIRRNLRQLPTAEEARTRLELDPILQTLVITGASQGAKTVNEGVLDALSQMKLQGWQILHLAGRDHADAVRTAYREISEKAGISVRVIDFTPDMSDVWAAADLAVSRAGASSCAELTACGVPSILLPYPFHKDKHQRLNAQVLADAGAAILCDDEMDAKKNGAKLRPILESLMFDSMKRRQMSAAARKLGHPDAADAVAAVVTQMLCECR